MQVGTVQRGEGRLRIRSEDEYGEGRTERPDAKMRGERMEREGSAPRATRGDETSDRQTP